MEQPVISPPSIALFSNSQTWVERIIDFYPTIVIYAKAVVGFLVMVSIPLSVFFFVGIIYCVRRLKQIRLKEAELYDLKVEPAFEKVETKGDDALAKRWAKIIGYMEGNNPNDWKQAIIEADIILDDILTKMGYRGESVGEKLKRVEKGDFATLDDAWEAHKVRNAIAHEPGFSLTEHAAKHAFHMYKKVFEEFYYI